MTFRLSLAALLAFIALPASAETLTCTEVDTLPFTIGASGSYCLAKNLSTNQYGGGGILVNASDVHLDCNQHFISNGNATNEDVGIASSGRRNVTIENCTVKGFSEGIHFDVNSYNTEIRNNTVLNAKTYGILVWGSRTQIVDNSVLETKYVSDVRDYNQAIYIAPIAPGGYAWDVVVRGNRVLGVSGTKTLQAIRVDRAVAPIISNNHVGGLSPKTDGTAYALMIDGTNPVISGNILTARPGDPVTGIAPSASSLCTGNILTGMKINGLEWCGLAQGNVAK